MRLTHTTGVTITSVLVATALAGIVSAVVAQLLTNQSKVMRTLSLRAERENLLKHYRDTLISGWDNTLTNGCSSGIYDRAGSLKVPSGGLTVKSDDLYSSSSVSDGWWKVSFDCGATAGTMFASDKHKTTHGSGMRSETHHRVTLKVEFLKDEHPHISTALRTRQETFYMHQQKRLVGDTDCRNEDNRTRMNTYQPDLVKVSALLSTSSLELYKGEGAVIQYDFNTNYTKCSQVPLVRAGSCAYDAAIIGFWGTSESVPISPPTSDYEYLEVRGNDVCFKKTIHPFDTACLPGITYPYVYGDYVCSHDGAIGTSTPPNTSSGEYIWYHPKVDALPDTAGDTNFAGTARLITAYVGRVAGTDASMHNFGHDGCQHDGNPSNTTYVSYIDGSGTAYCQTSRHVVEDDIKCTFDVTDLPSGVAATDDTVNSWGDDSIETSYESELSTYGALARGRAAGKLTRKERDGCWSFGNGAFKEFHTFGHPPGPGFWNRSKGCVRPGHRKGPDGGRGGAGDNGTGPAGPPGPPGPIIWNTITP
ncbi:MAG: hypothetical protein OYH77_08335 [Pseudomonadota bacterium]|nr:hypothetical protein [Pseudomonadota bacterium]